MAEVNMSRVEMFERQKAGSKKAIEMLEAIQRLYQNDDFRKVIVEGFCLHEAARYAKESGDPALSEKAREDSLLLAQAAGHLERYLEVTQTMGLNAMSNAVALDQALNEERAGNTGDDE